MGGSKLIFSFILLFSSLCCSSFVYSNHKCPVEQRDALLVFKQNISSINNIEHSYWDYYSIREYCEDLHGSSYVPIKMNWNRSTDCCDWVGITCNNLTGDVIALNLNCSKLQGVSELDILLSSLPKLQVVDLSYNRLSIVTRNDAPHVKSDLNELRLASCNLIVLPEFLSVLKNLRVLDLSFNNIQGHIPVWAREIGGNNLTYLDLSHNSITSLPGFRSDGLQHLYIESNLLQGSFPPWICDKKNLKYLDISHNYISGMFPKCLQNISSSLVSLVVASNMIQGTFPMTVCNMSNLLYLDMSNNSFDGVIPQCFGNITSSLAMINLGKNKFHGTIPNVYKYCGLYELNLNANKLEGKVPRSLAKCESLKILGLGHNKLNDTFPRWLGDLPKLQILNLRSNNLHGIIETPSAREFLFPSLVIFDIADNDFIGPLPEKYLENFNTIEDVEKDKKTDIRNIMIITYMDLSSNRFEGEIPNVIGNLKFLRALNLSNNNLSGQIPDVLGNLLNMELLDLSRNQLVGEIPQTLNKLSFLLAFNVSQNHLVGRIPTGSQLQTFDVPSIYSGNPGLCGRPLETLCEDLSSQSNRGEWVGMESVMLGLGTGSLLGVMLGYGMLSTGKPKWVNAIANAEWHTKPKKKKLRKRS